MVDNSTIKHLLVFRFSSLGDVAMTVPVVKQLLSHHPDLRVTFVSDQKFKSLFNGIARLDFFAADLLVKHKGLRGLYQLYRTLKKENKITAIADLHNVLRTRILSFFFKFSGIQIKRIDKGRSGKKALTRKKNKKLIPLPSTFRRYADVFAKTGFPFELTESVQRAMLQPDETVRQLLGDPYRFRIGVAPFAKHKEKLYPLFEMEKLVAALAGKGYSVYLFGGGIGEINQLERWEKQYPGSLNIAGELAFEDELALISNLDLMISMDSANMHLASLFGIPVLSIWGATHPFAGFYGFGQDYDNIVQADLYCRPCSVFGNKTCYRGDWACMNMIQVQEIIDKTENLLQKIKK